MALTSRAALGFALLLTLPGPLPAEELLVFAAASLSDALREIGREYEAATGNEVAFNFAASGALARQIEAGAPADLFFSADRERVDTLERAGLVRAADRVDVLSNTLAVVVPAASAVAIRTPPDLRGLRRIAVADPEAVPVGVYARRWLLSLGLWDRLQEKLVPVLDARAVLAAVATESVDAGIVYATDAASSRRVRVALEVPQEKGPAIVYCVASLASSRKAGTPGLLRFLLSARAREVYRRLGFIVIAPE